MSGAWLMWRMAGVAALTGGLIAGGTLPALGSASAAAAAAPAAAITIGATSKIAPFRGLVYVTFRSPKYGRVTIHGHISGAVSGDVATLWARAFGRAWAPTRQSVTLGSSARDYSFAATPRLATRYKVELATPGSSGTRDATSTVRAVSAVRAVYVTAKARFIGGRRCSRPVCRQTYRIYTVVPASAFRTESHKHAYTYLGLRLSPVRKPPAPRWLYLDHHAYVKRARQITSIEFEQTLKISFRIGADGYHFTWAACTTDAETIDGLGLPGHHRCGVARIRADVRYLGSPSRMIRSPS